MPSSLSKHSNHKKYRLAKQQYRIMLAQIGSMLKFDVQQQLEFRSHIIEFVEEHYFKERSSSYAFLAAELSTARKIHSSLLALDPEELETYANMPFEWVLSVLDW